MGTDNLGQYPGSLLTGPSLELQETATESTSGNVTLTIAQFFNKIFVRETGAAARTDVTPTARAICNCIAGVHIGSTFLFIVRNVSAAAHDVNISGGTGVTVQGSAATPQSTQTIYLGYVTAVGNTPTVTITNFNTSTLVIGGGGGTDSITAFATGGQTNATAMTSNVNRVTTVATAADSVKLPAATAGRVVYVANDGANSMQVFGAATETINGVASATGVPQPVGTRVAYISAADGKWVAFNLGTSSSGNVAVLYDENAKPGFSISTGAVSAVNNLTAFNSATGNGSNNAVGLVPSGTDTHVGLLFQPKGASGTVVIGLSTGTAQITVGASSGAQTVAIGDGAGVSTVNIANTTVAGANVNVASAVTGAGITDTVTISGGNAAATGIKVVNILTGTPGTSGNNRLTMGGGATSAVSVKAVLTHSMTPNYIATESGANNAIAGALLDAGGVAVPLAAGLRVTVKLAHTLQAGANTFVLNTVSKAIKSHLNAANDIATVYAATGFIDLLYDGVEWLDMSQ